MSGGNAAVSRPANQGKESLLHESNLGRKLCFRLGVLIAAEPMRFITRCPSTVLSADQSPVGDQGAVEAYYAFNKSENIRLAECFLRDNGVADFVWI